MVIAKIPALLQFSKISGRPFSLAFLGTAVVLLWNQCMVYGGTLTDKGLTTIELDYARCAFIVVLTLIAWRNPFSEKTQFVLACFSVVLMTIGSSLFLLEDLYALSSLDTIAAVLCGAGVVWVGGMWINFYARLNPAEAFFCTFLSLALSALLGFFIVLVPVDIMYAVCLFLPSLALAMFQIAQRRINDSAHEANISTPVDTAYLKEPKSTTIRLIAGITFLGIAVGFSHGFPDGSSIEKTAFVVFLEDIGVIALSLFFIHLILVRRIGLRLVSLWAIQIAGTAVGVLLLASQNSYLALSGAAIIDMVVRLYVATMWYLSYDVSRHTNFLPYIVLGFFWLIRQVTRDIGRAIILAIGPYSVDHQILIIAIMMCMLAASMLLLFSNDLPKNRAFFADIAAYFALRERADSSSQVSRANYGNQQVSSTEQAFDYSALQSQYGLTERELEVILMVADGRSAPYIADKLFLSVNTVKSYIKGAYSKLGVHSKKEVAHLIGKYKQVTR